VKNTDKKCSLYQIFVDDFQLTEVKKTAVLVAAYY